MNEDSTAAERKQHRSTFAVAGRRLLPIVAGVTGETRRAPVAGAAPYEAPLSPRARIAATATYAEVAAL